MRSTGSILGITSLLLLFVFFTWSNGQTQNLNGASIFADHKARRVGDVLTVLVTEEAAASSRAKTATEKESGLDLEARGGLSDNSSKTLLGARGDLGNKFSGSGKTERQGSLKARISAVVVNVRENGDLEIQGSREVNVNGEKEITTITGVVRPADISAQNTVQSYNIAEAQISYKGKGAVHSGQRPGFLARLFNWLF